RVVIGAQLLAFLRQLVDAPIARPVADWAVPVGPERLPEPRRRLERLVRIEGLDLQDPVTGVAVAVEELEAAGEALDGRKILLLADELTVDDVVAHVAALLLAELARMIEFAQALPMRLHHRLPLVAFLAADEFVAVIARVIGGAAILPVVEMVGDEMAVDAGLAEQLRKGIVERLQRSPAAVQEGEPAGLHVASRRHAGQAADIV